MRIAISNIAWEIADDAKIIDLLNRYSINAIDIAPSKYFPDLSKVANTEVLEIKNKWMDAGIEITGMQSLLFGTVGMNMFGEIKVQQAMLKHLTHVCHIGAQFGAKKLVFGSPKNRDRVGLNDQEVMDIAIPFFLHLGDIAASFGVVICVEPNPICYGANFIVNSFEAVQIVKLVNHPSIKMQLDTGALVINNENLDKVLMDSANLIGHIHASEPHLVPLGDCETNHGAISQVIKQYLPLHTISIEMLATKEEPHLISIERALNTAIRYYGNKLTKDGIL